MAAAVVQVATKKVIRIIIERDAYPNSTVAEFFGLIFALQNVDEVPADQRLELHTDSSSMIASVLKDRSEDFMAGPTGLLAGQVTSMECFKNLDLRKTKAHRGHAEAIAQGDAANWLGNHRADQEADYAVADQLPNKSDIFVFQQRRTAAHTWGLLGGP